MSIRALVWARAVPGLDLSMRTVLCVLADYAGSLGECEISDEAIASDSGCCVEFVANALRDLERVGLITVSEDGRFLALPRNLLPEPAPPRNGNKDRWKRLRARVFERDGYACTYCGATEAPFHCDHVTPVSKGGETEMDNLTTACAFCNVSKGNRPLSEWKGRS